MKKTVLYVHHGKGIGGAPLSLLYMIQALDREQFHPIVLFLHHSEIMDVFRNHNIEVVGPVHCYDFPHTRIWWLRWYHVGFFIKVLHDTIVTRYRTAALWFNKIKPDIVHLNTSSLIAWGIAARKKNIPVVWHIRESLASGYFGLRKTMIARIIKHHATAIVPISNHDALPWINNKKTTVVYNAVNPIIFDHTSSAQSLLKRYNLAAHHPKILFLGGLSAEKGTSLLLTIFEELRLLMPSVHLLLAGYFPQPQHVPWLQRYTPAYRFARQVHQQYQRNAEAITLLGPMLTIQEAFAAADVIVFPATVGHFARPIIEAGFMKKAVIASHLAPLDELIIHGQTGYLIDPLDTTGWVATLLTLLQNKQEQNRLGQAAYYFCTERFSLTKQRSRIESIYQPLGNHRG